MTSSKLRCLLRPPINSIDLSDKVAQPAYLRMAEDALNLRRPARASRRASRLCRKLSGSGRAFSRYTGK